MPYIEQGKRPEIDKLVDPLFRHIDSLPMDQQDGAVNYTVTLLVKSLYSPPKYFTYDRGLGTLIASFLEFYRTEVAPYEDKKRKENGEVVPLERKNK